MNQPPKLEAMLSLKQISELTGISMPALKKWKRAGILPKPDVCVLRTIRWRRDRILAGLQKERKR